MNHPAPHRLTLEPIDAHTFAPFGHVFGPTGDAGRRDHFNVIENRRPQARINLAQVQADDRRGADSITLCQLERHPGSSQSFFPQDVDSYLVIVCDNGPDDRPLLTTARAFRVPGHTGVTYKPNVWHAGISVLEGGRNFLVVIYEDGTPGDCEFVDIADICVDISRANHVSQG